MYIYIYKERDMMMMLLLMMMLMLLLMMMMIMMMMLYTCVYFSHCCRKKVSLQKQSATAGNEQTSPEAD